jgi:hypothetical protein
MTSARVPERSADPGGFALANLSLGAAFALSALLSPGAKLFAYLGVTSVLRILPHYQQHLVLALVSYWIPAVLVYLLMRVLRIDRRLRPNAAVHLTILLANVLLVLYVAARVFASTVPGGGGSFVVVSLSRFVIVPAWVLLAIGFVTLMAKSIVFATRTSIQPEPRRRSLAEAFVVACALGAPLAFALTLPIQKMVAHATEFDRLCKTAEIKVYEAVKPPKGIAVLPDSFSYMPPRRQAETRPFARFLLNQSSLEFIERPATKETGIVGKAKYERVRTTGERNLQAVPGHSAGTQFAYEPTDTLTAEYEVRPTSLGIPRGAELRLGGARIEIRRRGDDKLIALAQYYWNNTEFRACPQESHQALFVYHFVTDALGVKNPKVPK